jgi:hypothetical protein
MFWDNITVIVLCIGFMVAGAGIGYVAIPYFDDLRASRVVEPSLDLKNCSTGSIIDDSECLNSEFSGFFHYNISQIGKEISEGELMASGGVCSHATKWYEKRMDERGYYTEDIIIKTNKTSYDHEFLVVSNDKAYCILDQKIVKCFEFAS